MGTMKTASAYPTAFAARENDYLRVYQGALENTCAPVDSQTFVSVFAGSMSGYADWTGFDFPDIPDNAIVQSVEAHIRTLNIDTSGGYATYICRILLGGDAGNEREIRGKWVSAPSSGQEYAKSEVIELSKLTGQYTTAQLRNMAIQLRWYNYTNQDSAFCIFGMTATATYEAPPTEYAVVGGILRPVNAKFTGGGC